MFVTSVWHSLAYRCLTPVTWHLLHVCLSLSKAPLPISAQSHWIRAHTNGLILTWSPLHRSYFQTRSHSEVLGFRLQHIFFFGGWGWGWAGIVKENYNSAHNSNRNSFFQKFSKVRTTVLHVACLNSLPRKMLSFQRFCSARMFRYENIKLLIWSVCQINLLCLKKERFFAAGPCQDCARNCLFLGKYSLLSIQTGKNQTPFFSWVAATPLIRSWF